MAQDLLQIALEHHRAGRLTEAQAGYEQAIAQYSANADAHHWLGVLLCQAGRFDEALPLLKAAAAARPNDPAYAHNLGQACQRLGRLDEAVTAFESAARAQPDHAAALRALATALLSRCGPGDVDFAIGALQQSHELTPPDADSLHHLGVALTAAGRYVDAVAALRQSLQLRPHQAPVLHHLALAARGAGDLKETRKSLIKALEIEPGLCGAWTALGMLDAEVGNLAAAAGSFRRAIAADRNDTAASDGLARVLEQSGDARGARAAVEQARRVHETADAEAMPACNLSANASSEASSSGGGSSAGLPSVGPGVPQSTSDASVADLQRRLTPTEQQSQVHFAMAALMNVFPPVQTPGNSVAGLFDRYAPRFDQHLLETLEYQAPQALLQTIAPLVGTAASLDIFDAGCGTGLCGELFRPMARRLVGVDLSPAMVDKARERGVYDAVHVGDLVDYLKTTPAAFDLILCADVLIYLGEAAPLFQLAYEALRPGGLFAYSVEAGSGDRYELVPRSRRYRHSQPYLRHLARIFGFTEEHFDPLAIRKEHAHDVNGFLVVLRRPGP